MRTVAYEIVKNSSYVILLPLVLGILSFRRNTKANQVLTIHIIIAALFTVVYAIMWHRRQNNLPLLHVYTVVEFIFLSMYYAMIFPSKNAKAIMALLALGFTGFAVLNALHLQDLYTFNSYTRGLEALIMLLYGGAGFYFLLKRPEQQHLYNFSFFWINTGYFIYFAASLFLFMLTGYMALGDMALYAWAGHALVMLGMYTMVSIGLWKRQ